MKNDILKSKNMVIQDYLLNSRIKIPMYDVKWQTQ